MNNIELIRTETNSGSVSSYRVRTSSLLIFSYQNTENYYNSVLSVCSVVDYPYLDSYIQKKLKSHKVKEERR
ncbi:MAG: hypothetical protein L6282_05990 [Candidatus Methanoperedenaceae archaeon]|nr:hypothetical protein [Candidatus Methanoperedenaceae archaeon]